MQRIQTTDDLDSELENMPTVDATGTWESILAWAKWSNLDREQATAFEIMVVTYVLTFCEEAEDDVDDQMKKKDFEVQRRALR